MKHVKSMFSVSMTLFIAITVLFTGCMSDFEDEYPPAELTAVGEVQFSFTPGQLALEPELMVLNFSTPKGDVENARVYLNKEGNTYVTKETLPLAPGEYTLTSWVAYSSDLRSTATSTDEFVPFTVTAGSQVINVESPAAPVPFDRFSAIDESFFTQGRAYGILPVGDGEIFMLGQGGASPYDGYWNSARLSTKGDVIYGNYLNDEGKVLPHYFGATLTGGNVATMVNLSRGGVYSPRFDIMILDVLGRIINPDTGEEIAQITGVDLFGWLPGYDWATWALTFIHDVRATPDGGFVVFGQAYLEKGAARPYFLVKFNAEGTIVWKKEISAPKGITFSSVSNYMRKMSVASDGNISIVGKMSNLPFVIRYNNTGDSITWADHSVAGNAETALGAYYSTSSTSDNGVIISTGSSEEKHRLVKLDANGELHWVKDFTDKEALYRKGQYTAVNTGFDGSIIAGATFMENSAGTPDFRYIQIYRLDLEGNVIKESGRLGGPGDENDKENYLISLFETNNSNELMRGVVALGFYAPLGTGAKEVPWLFKIPSPTLEVSEKTNAPTGMVFPN